MPLSFSTSNIRFRATYAITATPTLTFTDLIQTDYNALYGWTTANVKGILKITDPAGTVIYANVGWSSTTPSFTSPDIVGSVPTWAKTGITLALDEDDNVVKGDYVFEYWLTNGVSNYYFSKTYDFQYVTPDVDIELTVSCRTSELSSEDVTEYDIDGISPTITRTHTITQPIGGGMSPVPGSTSDALRTIGGGSTDSTRLWTGTWQTSISSILSYNMETWGTYTWVVITETVTGYDSIEVACDDCGCVVNSCIQNLIEQWKTALLTNGRRAGELQVSLIKLLSAWMNYQMAERCGDDYSTFCDEIRSIVVSENCLCADDADDSPHVIIPWGGTSTTIISGGGGNWSSGTTAPSGGSSGDYYIYYDVPLTFMEIYENSGGTWTSLGNLVQAGPTGPSGLDGSQIFNSAIDPVVGDGVNGDYHFNSATNHLWYKTGGVWTDLGLLGATGPTGPPSAGPSGPTGPQGSLIYNSASNPVVGSGNDGDYHLNTATNHLWYKTGGTWTDIGLLGETGPAGPAVTGPTGPIVTGPIGTPGSQIYNSTIDPVVGTGTDGDYHINTATDHLWYKTGGAWTDLGPMGSTGPSGASITGPTGPTGPANILYEATATITATQLKTSVGSALTITLLAAPSAGTSLDVVSVEAQMLPIGSAYTSGSDGKIYWDGDTQSYMTVPQAFIQSSGGALCTIIHAANAVRNGFAKALKMSFTADFATGDGRLVLHILYRIVSVPT